MVNRKMNLQLFAEGGEPQAEGGQQRATEQQAAAGQNTADQHFDFDELLRTNAEFRAEFDRRVTKSLNTAQKKTRNEQLTNEELNRKLDAMQAQITGYQRKELAAAAKVDPRFTDYVIYKVEQNLPEDGDFGEALTAFVKENSQYLVQAETPQPTGQKTNIGGPTGKSNGPMTKEEIRKIKDPAERQAAIAANLKLYQNNR